MADTITIGRVQGASIFYTTETLNTADEFEISKLNLIPTDLTPFIGDSIRDGNNNIYTIQTLSEDGITIKLENEISIKGEKGDTGDKGSDGQDAIMPTFEATASSIAYGQEASATATTSDDKTKVTLEFEIPKGEDGKTPKFTIGDVITGNAGTDASVSADTTTDGETGEITVTLSFEIPRGADGADATASDLANLTFSPTQDSTLSTATSYNGQEDVTIGLATENCAGLMSKEDKERLDDVYNAIMTADTLENSSWIVIATAAANGTAKSKWKIGDTKTITLTTGEEITVRIIGFDHDAANSITFEMVDLLSTTYAHHTSNTNAGGWEDSDIRSTLNGDIFNSLPFDLQSVIRTVEKKSSAGSQSTTIVTTQDKLFLHAFADIFSASAIESSAWSTISGYASTYTQEGEQYEYYKDLLGDFDPNNSTSLLQKQRNGSNASWWLRAPYVSSSTSFWYFYSGYADVDNSYASNSYGVAFSFCV